MLVESADSISGDKMTDNKNQLPTLAEMLNQIRHEIDEAERLRKKRLSFGWIRFSLKRRRAVGSIN